ncbi:recombinase family protein [Fulvimarina manganoxydans]|uniref:recombinase family protein n=1 Tax=Fulvimarina manganoxydans TaxID=937218 RepID=UPI000A055E2E|nr:recombinase family protein [Fulvimarina manganoxydans]
MLTRLYLRASTKNQDAERARAELEAFAEERGLTIVGTYVENENGAHLARPELFRLLKDSRRGDVLLVEQVDRLSRLTTGDWQKLRAEIAAKGVRIVALDLPTSYLLANSEAESFTARIADAINAMLLDMLAAVARKDYEDRQRRQAQGIAKAQSEGRYRGRPENKKRNQGIARMLASGMSYSQIQDATNASRATIAKIVKATATE